MGAGRQEYFVLLVRRQRCGGRRGGGRLEGWREGGRRLESLGAGWRRRVCRETGDRDKEDRCGFR